MADDREDGIIERDELGRWLPGCKGGPGRPPVNSHLHRQALLDAVKPEEIRQVFRTLLDKALAGDVGAARVLLDRLFGRVGVFDDGRPDVQIATMLVPVFGPADPMVGYCSGDGDEGGDEHLP